VYLSVTFKKNLAHEQNDSSSHRVLIIKTITQYYLLQTRNFLTHNWPNVILFVALVYLIIFAGLHTWFEADLNSIKSSLIIVIVSHLLSLSFIASSIHSINGDAQFLKAHLDSFNYSLFRTLQIFTINLFLSLGLLVVPLFLKLVQWKDIFIWLPLPLLAAGMIVSLYKPTHKITQHPAQRNLIFRKHPSFLTHQNWAILGLQWISIGRLNFKKNIYGIICWLAAHAVTAMYFFNSSSEDSSVYFLMSYAIIIYFASHQHCEELASIDNYIKPYKWNVFKSDSILWTLIMIANGIVCVLIDLLVGKQNTEVIIFITTLACLILIYIMMIKHRYLDSNLVRTLAIAFSIAVPLSIPIFITLFLMDVKNDSSQ
jgi:hypothetical protein